jgi:hypothetical protein
VNDRGAADQPGGAAARVSERGRTFLEKKLKLYLTCFCECHTITFV